MIPQHAFLGMAAFIVLWMLSLIGAVVILPSWLSTEPEYEEGAVTPGGRYLVWARMLLTIGCIVVWACTMCGHLLTGPNDVTFGFWQNHATLLQASLVLTGSIFVFSMFLVRKSRGSRQWILWLATSVMATASLVGSLVS